MAPRGTPQGARRLGGFLSPMRRGSALVRRVRGRGAGGMSAVRWEDAAPLSVVRRPVQLDVHPRLRVLRHAAPRSRALRDEDPPPLGRTGARHRYETVTD